MLRSVKARIAGHPLVNFGLFTFLGFPEVRRMEEKYLPDGEPGEVRSVCRRVHTITATVHEVSAEPDPGFAAAVSAVLFSVHVTPTCSRVAQVLLRVETARWP